MLTHILNNSSPTQQAGAKTNKQNCTLRTNNLFIYKNVQWVLQVQIFSNLLSILANAFTQNLNLRCFVVITRPIDKTVHTYIDASKMTLPQISNI